MKLVLISDTHTKHPDIAVPDGDVLVHAGDITYGPKGHEPFEQYEAFSRWIGALPHKHKIVIPGNHDFLAEKRTDLVRSVMTNCTFLIDESVTINGVHFYGTPWTPWFCDWAFNASETKRKEVSLAIPRCDVLISHGPPNGILDLTRQGHVGCELMRSEIVGRIHPKVHVFGHIHEGYGVTTREDILFVNASSVNAKYEPVNKPVVVEYYQHLNTGTRWRLKY